jgi:hypothetical protein
VLTNSRICISHNGSRYSEDIDNINHFPSYCHDLGGVTADVGFGVVTGFIEQLQPVITTNSSAVATSNTPQFTAARTVFSVYCTYTSPLVLAYYCTFTSPLVLAYYCTYTSPLVLAYYCNFTSPLVLAYVLLLIGSRTVPVLQPSSRSTAPSPVLWYWRAFSFLLVPELSLCFSHSNSCLTMNFTGTRFQSSSTEIRYSRNI